ncbi:anthocyanidin 3-O-glucoside 2'''-O-xylosyltransferase [Ranunculus cassubicifolius]
MATPTFHALMFPWFAVGHITPFIDLSNKLAERGHRVSFLIPRNTQNSFNHLNLHPNLIQFIPLTVPQVDGVPPGAETMSDVPIHKFPLLAKAFDRTQDQVETALHNLRPDIIFFDFSHWLPNLAQPLGSKCIFFCVVSPVTTASVFHPSRKLQKGHHFTVPDLMEQPPGYPFALSMKALPYEVKSYLGFSKEFDGEISQFNRLMTSFGESHALCYRACTEIEGPFIEYMQKHHNKQVLLIGPNFPKTSHAPLEDKWDKWLSGFKKGSVVYCAFGSECVLEVDQFQELVLGLELTGLPFIVRLKPPFGVETLEEALPEGFAKRVRGRGLVYGGWVQQQEILSHPSVGCFVSHCGSGSIWESWVSSCQIVALPHVGSQFKCARFMASVLKVAVTVERREEDGWFTKESICRAVKLAMDEGSEVGNQIKENHLKLKELLLTDGFESSYMNTFLIKLQDFVK